MYDWLSSTSVKFGQATRLFNFGCSQLRLKLARKDKNESRCGGQMVSVLALSSDNTRSTPAKVYSFSVKLLSE